MNTTVLPVNPRYPQAKAIAAAARALQQGGLVAFPTETVYGLGANAMDADAIRRLYRAKERPASNPLIVHVADLAQLEGLVVDAPESALTLAQRFWPGPLTLVLKRHPALPDLIAPQRDTVALRLPAHTVARALIRATGRPLVAPSANRFARPSATRAAHVLADLEGRIDLLLDGGPTRIGLESTVLDLSRQAPVLLRPGAITLEELRAQLPDLRSGGAMLDLDDDDALPDSPGQHRRHYSPRAGLLLYEGEAEAVLAAMQDAVRAHAAGGRRVGLLGALPGLAGCEQVSPGEGQEAAGRGLFAALRELDERGVDVILARLEEPGGLGAAINDRLRRAAEGRIIRV
ncbi:MAG: L-threonylcarbamoyladenylate synthase [Anaerolineaceae bacterium]|nr:L-threonylcarbamoyladenylate synthase [Anaerolineaceae bacterium]